MKPQHRAMTLQQNFAAGASWTPWLRGALQAEGHTAVLLPLLTTQHLYWEGWFIDR